MSSSPPTGEAVSRRRLKPSLVGLPVEILCMIFGFVDFSNLETPKPYAQMLSISQVCIRWRNAALSFPPMWTWIYIPTHMYLIRRSIHRSKGLPLSIYLLDGSGARTNEVTFLLCYSHRLKEIHFQVCEPGILTRFRRAQLPILETLVLNARNSPPVVYDFPIARMVDSQGIPPLRHLKLSRYCTNLNIPFLSHLRNLSICHRPATSSPPTFNDLSALKHMKHLESLEFIRFSGLSEHIPHNFHVELPQLRELHLLVNDPCDLKVLKHLSCPSMTSIVARTDVPFGRVASDTLIAEVSTAFYSLVPGTPSAWAVKASVSLWTRCSANAITITLPPSNPPLQLVLMGEHDYTIRCMLPCFHSEPLLVLHTLEVVVTDSRRSKLDRTTFQSFLRSLDTLELHVHDVDDLSSLFFNIPTDSQPCILLPSLKGINVELAKGRLRYSERNLRKLGKALSERNSRQGGVLEVLRFRSHLDKPLIEMFQTVAQRVELIRADGTTEEL
ncbi:hypothetical protein ONZ45_g7856 [Pleurotus djamor]|nr:hypothetical protein ONZ45_g7856 [Pleurotus djamor]